MTIDFAALERRFTELLGLDRAPIAISLLGAAPTGVRRFMGQVPSGCSFWSMAASAPAGKSAFYTVPSDHFNCPVGSYTHQIDLPAERAAELGDVLGLMTQIGYLKMEEVPGIPRWETPPAAVVYARLGEAPLPPDVVMFALTASAAMRLNEAAAFAGVSSGLAAMGRPTCMAIPAAVARGATMSLGCIGNRVYTDLADGHAYVAVRGRDIVAVADQLGGIVSANQKLIEYHGERKARLTVQA